MDTARGKSANGNTNKLACDGRALLVGVQRCPEDNMAKAEASTGINERAKWHGNAAWPQADTMDEAHNKAKL